MKTCERCGRVIVNGVNGCTYLGRICLDCNGGAPKYPAPIVEVLPTSLDYLDYAEDRILRDDDGLK